MPEWLRDSILGDTPPLDAIALRVALAWLAGFLVAGVYCLGIGRRKDETATLPTTLVLLTVVIAIVTLVIGNSVARAFGLVGALSIVRFRTVVEDTRDTAFVIFAVAVGMAMGAGYLLVAAAGIPAVLMAALVMRYVGYGQGPASTTMLLTLRLGLGQDPELLVGNTLAQHFGEFRLIGSATAKQGAAVEVTYRGTLRSPGGAYTMIADLHRLEGVQNAELRPAS